MNIKCVLAKTYFAFVLIWRRHRFSQGDDELGWSEGMLLVVSNEGIQWVKKHLVYQEIAHAAVLLLSVFDRNVVNLHKRLKKKASMLISRFANQLQYVFTTCCDCNSRYSPTELLWNSKHLSKVTWQIVKLSRKGTPSPQCASTWIYESCSYPATDHGLFRTRSERSERSVRATNTTRSLYMGSDELGGRSCAFEKVLLLSEKWSKWNETSNLSV